MARINLMVKRVGKKKKSVRQIRTADVPPDPSPIAEKVGPVERHFEWKEVQPGGSPPPGLPTVGPVMTDRHVEFVAADPWAHRSAGMQCCTCMAYVPKAGARPGPHGLLGRCRRNAPTMSGFPAVFGTDWCLEHKLDETKL